MKFCGECGAPIPQVKKCHQCGMELPLKAKFCFGCGAPQGGGAGGGAAGVAMGDKNVIAGDVIGQKVAGDSVGNKIMGNAVFNTYHDETKEIVSCAVCGRHLTTVEVHTCPKCGRIVCADHFNAKRCCCTNCARKAGITVDAGGNGDFRTVSEALSAATEGDTILVKPGVYREHFVVDKSVTIVGGMDGNGNLPVIWESLKSADSCICLRAAATLRNLELSTKMREVLHSVHWEDGRHYEAIDITADATLENVSVHGFGGDGVRVSGAVAPDIRNCRIFDNQGCGILFLGGGGGSMSGCDIFNNEGGTGIWIQSPGTAPTISSCKIHEHIIGIDIDEGAVGIIENCDIFENEGVGIHIGGGGTAPRISNCKIHNGELAVNVDEGAAGDIQYCDVFENERGVRKDKGAKTTFWKCRFHNKDERTEGQREEEEKGGDDGREGEEEDEEGKGVEADDEDAYECHEIVSAKTGRHLTGEELAAAQAALRDEKDRFPDESSILRAHGWRICGNRQKKGAFCGKCGAPIPDAWGKCPSCGKWNAKESTHCWNCDHELRP